MVRTNNFVICDLTSQVIGFIFPIHWSELSTSLKATLRVSDLSFGSLKRNARKRSLHNHLLKYLTKNS